MSPYLLDPMHRYTSGFVIVFHRDDDFSLGVAFFKVPDRLGCFTQRVTSINHGDDFAGFHQLFDNS
jgi:hypothetical protein